jgi:hypothetical protein
MLRKERIGDTKLQLALVKEVIFQLEVAQEHRLLTPSELDLRKQLKLRSVGLALIEKSRIIQRSSLTYISCGDANAFFSVSGQFMGKEKLHKLRPHK